MHRVKILWMLTVVLTLPLLFVAGAVPSYLLPINSDIGQVIEGESGTIESYAKEALTTAYTPEWVERYIPPSLMQGFVHTYDTLLASMLPVSTLQMGRAIHRTHLWEVPFAIIEPAYRWGSMVWMDQSDGRWALLSISISE